MFRSILLALVLLPCLFRPAAAVELVLSSGEIAIGETAGVTLNGAAGQGDVRWLTSRELGLIRTANDGAVVKALSAGNDRIIAQVGGVALSATVVVRDKPVGGASARELKELWGQSAPRLQRLTSTQRQMASMLRRANQALTQGKSQEQVAREFFSELARLDLKAPMVELNRLKTRLTEVGIADQALGEKFAAGGTPVERAVLVYRREVTMAAIRDAVHQVAASHGVDAVGSVYLAKIGKWAIQDPAMFTLAGDIDFSFLGARPDVIIALRDAFMKSIEHRTGLNMVALDSVATAHGFAEHMVYMGIQGRKFADDAMMAMDHGVEQIDFHNPDSVGTKGAKQVTGREALIVTVLEETARRYRERGNEAGYKRLSNQIEADWKSRRSQSVEPMLSMEMVRHLEADIVRNVDVFAAIDIVKKGSKYLRRSNDQITGDLHIPTADPAWARFVEQVDEKAKTATAEELARFIETESKKLGMTDLFTLRVENGRAQLEVAPGGAERFLGRIKEMIWKNVANGLDTRIRTLTDAINNRGRAAGPGTPDDLRPDRIADTIRMLAAGIDVMQHDNTPIPADIRRRIEILTKLIESYAGHRAFTLPAEELEKIREALRDAAANENSLLLKAALMADHIDKWVVKNYDMIAAKLPGGKAIALADAKIDALNSALDVLDNTTLGALRDRGVIELSLGTGADNKPRVAALKFPRVAAINQRLNQSILGQIGNNTAFKTFNLVQESQAYWSAITEANSAGQAVVNLATEIFRRRVPGGGAVEAYEMGNYSRVCVEVTYMIFPPLAVPEGLIGMGDAFYQYAKGRYWNAALERLIDSLYADAKFKPNPNKRGAYLLLSVKYKGQVYQRDELEKARAFILDEDVDATLTANLREADPFLALMKELQNHSATGDKVRAHFRQQADRRWVQVKRDYVRHLIEKLETRRAAQKIVKDDRVRGLFSELMIITEKLAIQDQVVSAMSEKWDTAGLKAYWTLLKIAGRGGRWDDAAANAERSLTDKERERAAAIVLSYRDAYATVLSARTKLESAVANILQADGVPAQPREQHNQRLLTGLVFLTGKPDADTAMAQRWQSMAERVSSAAERELLGIKAEYVPNPTLERGFDKRTAGYLFFEDLWLAALKTMKVPKLSRLSFRNAAAERQKTRETLIRDFRASYAKKSGTGKIWVRERVLVQRSPPGIASATVTVEVEGKPVRANNDGGGGFTVTGLKPGRYDVTVTAPGYKAEDGTKTARAVLEMPSDDQLSRIGEITVLMIPVAGDKSLSVSIQMSPADGRISDEGPNNIAHLVAGVTARPDSGKLRYQWTEGKKVLAQGKKVLGGPDAGREQEPISEIDVQGAKRGGQTLTVTVLVIDEQNREGNASVEIKVIPSGALMVDLKPHRAVIGADEKERLEVIPPPGKEYRYRWTISSGGKIIYVQDYSFDRFLTIAKSIDNRYVGKKLDIRVEVRDPDQRTGTAETTLTVRGEDEPSTAKDGTAAKSLQEQIDAAVAARDWSALLEMDAVLRDELKALQSMSAEERKKKNASQREPEIFASRDAINRALQTLRREREAWASGIREYLRKLAGVDAGSYRALSEQVEQAAAAYAEKNCTYNRSDPDACLKMESAYKEQCLAEAKRLNAAESKLIREAQSRKAMDRIENFIGGGRGAREYFEEAEKIQADYHIPFPLPDPVVPRVTYKSDCVATGPPVAAGKPGELRLQLTASKLKTPTGKPVKLTAGAKGGKPPYNYAWAGVVGRGTMATFTPGKAGKHAVTVTVTDSAGASVQKSVTVEGVALAVSTKGIGERVFYGSRQSIAAWAQGLTTPPSAPAANALPPGAASGQNFIFSSDEEGTPSQPATPAGKYRVIWQSEPAVSFEPATSENGGTWVTWDRIGEVKIWCELQEFSEGAWRNISECEQKSVAVEPPAFRITFEPENGKAHIGQRVTANVIANPTVPDKLLDIRWLEPASSRRWELTQNASRIAFEVRDTKPLALRGIVRVPVHGDEIAKVEASYVGVGYQVKVSVVEAPNRPMTWDPAKGGLVPVPQAQHVVGERIGLQAALTGGPPPAGGVRWTWQVNAGTSLSNAISQSPTISRSERGSIVAHVVASDREKRKLGEAELTLSVIESVPTSPSATAAGGQHTPSTPAEKQAEARRLAAQAKKDAEAGQFVEAEASVGKAKTFDSAIGNTAARTVATMVKSRGWDAAYKRDFPMALPALEAAARLAPQDRDAQDKLARTRRAATGWPKVEAEARRFDALVTENKLWSAREAMQRMSDLQRNMPGGMSNPLSRGVIDRFNAGLADYNAFMRARNEANTRAFNAKDWPAMLANAEQSLARELTPGDKAEAQSRIAFAKRMMRQAAPPAASSTTAVAAPLAAIGGSWIFNSSNEPLTFVQNGASVSGHYTTDDGQVVGQLKGNVLEGYWSETLSNRRCSTARNGRFYWGRARFVFKGDSFTARWSYCDDPPGAAGGWSGKRMAGGASGGSAKPPVAANGPASLAARFIDMKQDVVGQGGQASANGQPDGQFLLTVDSGGAARNINYIILQSADASGRPAGGQVWDTTPNYYWILGVLQDGRRLNPKDADISSPVTGRATFQLFANNSGYFKLGQNFLITVRFSDGSKATTTARVGETGGGKIDAAAPSAVAVPAIGGASDGSAKPAVPSVVAVPAIGGTSGGNAKPAVPSVVAVPAISGSWTFNSSDGPLTFVQNGTSVSGHYATDNGEVVGQLKGNVLEGYWSETLSNRRCSAARNGRFYWGRARFVFTDDRFTAKWSYCDDPPGAAGSWSGKRMAGGSAASSGKNAPKIETAVKRSAHDQQIAKIKSIVGNDSHKVSKFASLVQEALKKDGVLDPNNEAHVAAMTDLLGKAIRYGQKSPEYQEELNVYAKLRRNVIEQAKSKPCDRGSDSQRIAFALWNRAIVLGKNGKVDQAIKHLQQGLEYCKNAKAAEILAAVQRQQASRQGARGLDGNYIGKVYIADITDGGGVLKLTIKNGQVSGTFTHTQNRGTTQSILSATLSGQVSQDGHITATLTGRTKYVALDNKYTWMANALSYSFEGQFTGRVSDAGASGLVHAKGKSPKPVTGQWNASRGR